MITPDMALTSDFQAVIRRERAARGLGASEFARLIGVSRPSLDAYEKKGQVPKLELAAEIARRLGLTLDQLAGVAPPPETPPELRELADDLRIAAATQASAAVSLQELAQLAARLVGGPEAGTEMG